MAGRLSKVAVTPEFPYDYKSSSRRLYRVLEDIGASTSVRDMMIKTMTTREILESFEFSGVSHMNIHMYVFGSSFEGTTTPGLKSDIDTMVVLDFLPVATNITEAKHQGYCLLLVQDSYTPAGYCKLQFVFCGEPLTLQMKPNVGSGILHRDAEERICFTVSKLAISAISGRVPHGPAYTSKATQFRTASDIVSAVRSCTWPDCASEWLVRERHYKWPSQEQIDKCKTLGCFFVRVSHPNSDDNHYQWRLSFSLQERLLVTGFNSVQLKCYILLKMIKNEKIHKAVGEKSLTSYHFKTCMLYMIENTPADFWSEDNLLVCLHHCLQQMLECVETEACPNFFIPEENMFDGRISGQMKANISEILRQILSTDFKFLLSLETDMLGTRYQGSLNSGIIAPGYGQTASETVHLIIYCNDVYNYLLDVRSRLLDKCQNTISHVFAQEICKETHRFLLSDSVRHSVTEMREALSLLLPYVDITVMSVQTAEAKRMSASNEVIYSILTNERWHALSLEADPVSAKLKQASAMCMLGYCDLSLEILLSLQDLLEEQISVCGCYGVEVPSHLRLAQTLPVISKCSKCSYEDFVHQHFIPCVVYLPVERDLTPPALCYEMDRSAAPPTEDKMNWYDWAVVDGKVLFYFLLYLNHHHLGIEENAAADVRSISRIIQTDRLLSHPETALNVLGWIFKDRGLTAVAQMYFMMSLAVKPTHNAAILHLQDINSIV